MDGDWNSYASSLREQYLEYGFLDGLCRVMWAKKVPMDVLRSDTDRSGYDLLLDANGIQRHVQLKSSFIGSKTARQKVSTLLADQSSGCVVWIRFDPETLEQREFLWFGGKPGGPLPDLGEKVAKHTKGNRHGEKALRAAVRLVNKGDFEALDGFEALAEILFGDLT